jgi:hypothetical protein
MNWQFWEILLATYKPYLLTMVGLILLDVVMGIASALKQGKFEWAKLSDFYLRQVFPSLLGWVAFTVATYLVTPSLLGGSTGIVSEGVSVLAWGTVVVNLLTSIAKSVSEVFGFTLPMASSPPVATPPAIPKT